VTDPQVVERLQVGFLPVAIRTRVGSEGLLSFEDR